MIRKEGSGVFTLTEMWEQYVSLYSAPKDT
jgi:hypothetical protein